ncbi:MAG: hypothetical protein EBT66_05655 [Bacteroidetes bacterium]|nr:hypothetical protein [Bacteroidota bacterium]
MLVPPVGDEPVPDPLPPEVPLPDVPEPDPPEVPLPDPPVPEPLPVVEWLADKSAKTPSGQTTFPLASR